MGDVWGWGRMRKEKILGRWVRRDRDGRGKRGGAAGPGGCDAFGTGRFG